MATLTIRELPEQERPREKLARHGAATLTDSELLAILLRTGVRGANAVEVARNLLARYSSLIGLARCTVKELAAIKGVGPTKAVQLAAAFNLGTRLARENFLRRPINTPQEVFELVGPEMQALHRESLRVILLDVRRCLLRVEEISFGSLDETIAHPREIFRPAIIYSAHSFVLAHNHPSGDPMPSQQDNRLTRRLADAAVLLQIELRDHIIIGVPREGAAPYYSFREGGVLS